MKIWFINQYATTPQSTGGNRPFSLCRELAARGHEVVLVACTFDHGTKARRVPAEEVDVCDAGCRWGTVGLGRRARVRRVNDLHRIQNMLAFTWRVARLETEVG